MLGDDSARGFWPSLIASVLVHLGAGGAIVWEQSRQPAPLSFAESIPVQLVKLGKKRDPELLPRLTAPAEAPPPPPEGVSIAPKDDSKKKPDKQPQPKKELSDAARKLLDAEPSLIDRALAKVETDEGDPDGDAAGTTTDTAQAATGYQRALITAIRRSYVLPEAIPQAQRAFLKARVVLFISPSGAITEFRFTEQHPNALFMQALENLLGTVTLPPPPKEIASQVGNDGVEIVFRP